MGRTLAPVFALLVSVALLLLGNGLLGTLLPVRAQLEAFSTPVIGLLGSLYFFGFGFGCVLGPHLIQRVGHIRTFAALAALVVAVPLVHALFPLPYAWAALRIVAGLCLAGLYTVIESWLNQSVDNASRGTVLSVYIVVNLCAMTGGQLLLLLDSPSGPALFSLVAVLMTLAVVPIALTRAAAPVPPVTVRLRLRHLYHLSPVGILGCFTVGMTSGAFWTVAPAYVTALGEGPEAVSTFMAVAVFAGALAQWPLGRLSDQIDRRLVILGACLAAGLAGIGLFQSAHLPIPLLVLAGFFGAFALSAYALCIAHANDFIAPEDAVEASAGLLLTYAAGAVAGPLLAASAMSWLGPSGLFAATAVAHFLFALFVIHRIRQRAPIPADEREHFVLMEPRTSAMVFELDPRSETTTPEAAEAQAAATMLEDDLPDALEDEHPAAEVEPGGDEQAPGEENRPKET
ncbi:MFS transporter [Aquibaculum sediminis]|uniref:MFS transporter n=1 Tax=Aquibaculum sediminis TaxID=3231907 RepID=UPI0034537D18